MLTKVEWSVIIRKSLVRDKHRTLIIEQHRKKPTLKVRREKFKNQNQVNGSFFLRNRNSRKEKKAKNKEMSERILGDQYYI